MELENNALFWQKIETLYLSSDLIINRCKNSHHPLYDNLVYPTDYGYLKDTSGDGQEHIAVYKGSKTNGGVDAIVVCADILKKDMEVKLLLKCTSEEEIAILHFLNQTDFQKAIIIRKGNGFPSWAISKN